MDAFCNIYEGFLQLVFLIFFCVSKNSNVQSNTIQNASPLRTPIHARFVNLIYWTAGKLIKILRIYASTTYTPDTVGLYARDLFYFVMVVWWFWFGLMLLWFIMICIRAIWVCSYVFVRWCEFVNCRTFTRNVSVLGSEFPVG